MDKPLSLILEEAKIDYINSINEVTKKYNLSLYFVEIIFNGIYKQICDAKNEELLKDKIVFYNNEKSEEEAK